MDIKGFQNTVWKFYAKHERTLPWRPPLLKPHKDGSLDAYKVLVSEMMLQQTQVDRVIPKYKSFITQFPSWKALGSAPLKDVLIAWQGLGYNRRALFLKQTAEKVSNEYNGKLPSNHNLLIQFPGIGTYTAGAIQVFAYNKSAIFIETNIRTVFIHHFFADTEEKIHDAAIIPLIENTLDQNNPREWYYALMDYGSHLKRLHTNPSRRSVHHTRQSKFEGSHRQTRAQVLKIIALSGPLTREEIYKNLQKPRKDVQRALRELIKEKFIYEQKDRFQIM